MSGPGLEAKLVWRTLRRRPLATGAAVTSLALGCAAAIVVLSCTNAVLWKPLAAPAPGRIATIYGFSPTIGTLTNIAYPHLARIAERSEFEAVAAFTRMPLVWETEEGARRIHGELVSENYFATVRPRLELGRAPTAAGEVALGYSFWRGQFAGDAAAVGRSVKLSGQRFVITGVLAREFRGTLLDYMGDPKVWMTLASQRMLPFIDSDLRQDWVRNWFVGAARLRAGVTAEQAQTAATAVERAQPAPANATPRTARVFAAGRANFHPEARAKVTRTLAFCGGLAAMLLLLGCLNAALFLVNKALGETRQTMIERALGASGVRLMSRRMLEASTLCGAGLAVGSLAAAWWVRLLEAYPPPLAYLVFEPAWDWRVWWITAAAVGAAVVVSGMAPALVSVGFRARGGKLLRESLVAAQIAIAAAILVGAGFVTRTVMAGRDAELGFNPNGLVMAELELTATSEDERKAIVRSILQQLQGNDAAAASLMPLTVYRHPGRVRERAGGSMMVYSNDVSPGYFAAMGIGLVQGREFGGAPEAVVNETLARALEPSGNVVGRALDVLDEDARLKQRLTISGIARDARYHTLWQDRIPYFYTSTEAGVGGNPAILVRGADGAAGYRVIREAVERVVPGAVVTQPRTPSLQVAELMREQSYLASFFGTLGAIALMIAAAGLMASLFLMVTERTREIGIRKALGATRAAILRVVLRRGAVVTAAGLACGLMLGHAGERWLEPLAPGTRVGDWWPVRAAFVALLVVAVASMVLPAARAAAVDPLRAIRHVD